MNNDYVSPVSKVVEMTLDGAILIASIYDFEDGGEL